MASPPWRSTYHKKPRCSTRHSDNWHGSLTKGRGRIVSGTALVHEADIMYRMSDVDWSARYSALGEFVAEFEKIATGLRFTYASIMQLDGLNTWNLSKYILFIETIGPKHLSFAVSAATHELFPSSSALLEEANEIHKETTFLVERRNEIAHGEWHIGPEVVVVADNPEIPEVMEVKRKITKTGEKVIPLPTIQQMNDCTERTRNLVNRSRELFPKILQFAEEHDFLDNGQLKH